MTDSHAEEKLKALVQESLLKREESMEAPPFRTFLAATRGRLEQEQPAQPLWRMGFTPALSAVVIIMLLIFLWQPGTGPQVTQRQLADLTLPDIHSQWEMPSDVLLPVADNFDFRDLIFSDFELEEIEEYPLFESDYLL